ncbi:MAG: fibronectin type III domain-containing protein [Thermoguttaceae bacterium]|nr:fibronectin type III domain-containing protein [Thermoguttaceae bacterium]
MPRNVLSNWFRKKRRDTSEREKSSSRSPRVEALEDRALLSAASGTLWLDDAVATSAAEIESEFDAYNIDYTLLNTGRVRVLGQSGLQYYGSYKYCDVTDPIYIELWEQALARWEEIFTEGAPDETYPYDVDGETLEIDDIYLYFGFSDSYDNATSLGSSLNGGYYRDAGNSLPATGSMMFNAKYFVANPSETVQKVFYNTALHELSHSFGYNLRYLEARNVIEKRRETPSGLENALSQNTSYWYYVGENGVEQFQKTYPEEIVSLIADDAFLMETYSSSGSFGCHISSLYSTYYLYINQRDGMNYAISSSYEATLTAVTLGVLEDLGYSVDYDFADALDSPAPVKLTAQAEGADVVLTWQKGAGDRSAATSGAYYVVERCVDAPGVSREDRTWSVVADRVVEPSYVDRSVQPNVTYLYRVYRRDIKTVSEVCVTSAREGDVLAWPGVAASYRVYALIAKESNQLSWFSVASSVTSTNYTTGVLSYKPYDQSALYRVFAINTPLDRTAASKAARVTTEDFETRCVQEGNALFLRAKSPEESDEEYEYYWDVSNSREIDEQDFVKGSEELCFNPSASGYALGERALVRVMTRRGSDVSVEEFYVFQERVEPTFNVDAQTFCDGAATSLAITVPAGRAIARWTLDWGDGSEPLVVEALGYELNASHFYAPDQGNCVVTLNAIDCEGYGGEEYVVYRRENASNATQSASVQEETDQEGRDAPFVFSDDRFDEDADEFWAALRNSRKRAL